MCAPKRAWEYGASGAAPYVVHELRNARARYLGDHRQLLEQGV
jgi:hypothetical protein